MDYFSEQTFTKVTTSEFIKADYNDCKTVR